MAESKYGKYIITELKQDIVEAPWSPPVSSVSKGKGGRLLFLDSEVVKGAFYLECVWIMPRTLQKAEDQPKEVTVKPHAHEYDEVLCFFGTNPDDFYDLGGEVELWLGDEKHTITKSCIVFIPAGLQHCPLSFIRVDRPIFHFTSGPGKMYFDADKA
jgi:mannose-6-phosphate isomerase-like protein (cupin superfamily)